MTDMITNDIPGADLLIKRLGTWPSFHDAEVLELKLSRELPSAEMLIHVWRTTDTINKEGYFVCERHTLVRFLFSNMVSCELSGFNHQNVLGSLTISRSRIPGKPVFRVDLDPCYGLSGSILCEQIAVLEAAECDADGRLSLS